MPGMFDPDAEGYFSYAMAWSLPDAPELDASALEMGLESYFSGLAHTFATETLADSLPRAELARTPVEGAWEQGFRGSISAFEPLAAQEPIRLHVRAHVRTCPASGHRVALFELSPQPQSAPLWAKLGDMRERFRCRSEGG